MASLDLSASFDFVNVELLLIIIYAIFVSPLIDLAKMKKLADDNFVIKCNKCLKQLIDDMKQSLEMIIKWLKDSGLKVTDSKNGNLSVPPW